MNLDSWNDSHKGNAFQNREARRIIVDRVNAKDYLLSHCTIVASVDVEESDLPLGKHLENGFEVNRPYSDFLIKPECTAFVNNNEDSWERSLLLQTYKTFIGSPNYCFTPDTLIVLADGTQKPIRDVAVGDLVLTHTGAKRKVLKTFCRYVAEDLKVIYTDKHTTPIKCTGEHPFRALRAKVDAHPRSSTKPETHRRYVRQTVRSVLRGEEVGCAVSFQEDWLEAKRLSSDDYLLGAPASQQTEGSIGKATLLGYYLSEGCIGRGNVIFTFGSHEQSLADHTVELLLEEFGKTATVRKTLNSTLQVCVRGGCVVDWFKGHGGALSHSKRISSTVMSWDTVSLLALLSGWFAGDGSLHKKTGRLVGSTVSFDLACQLSRICDMAGVKASLWRESSDGFQKRAQRKSKITMARADGTSFEAVVQAKHPLYNIIASRGEVLKVAPFTPRWKNLSVSGGHASAAGWYEGKRVHAVSYVGSEHYSGYVHNFEVEGDNSYVLGQGGIAVHNCEHLQLPEYSKGRILDAVPRDIGPSVYIDILVGTERKHTSLINAILSDKINALSMGSSILFSICSQCGNVAADETELCSHIKFFKGNFFIDARGVKRKIAELCGHRSNPESNKFIEASWVANPAFKGAVLRNILNAEDFTPSVDGPLYSFPSVSYPQSQGMRLAAQQQDPFATPGDEPAKEAPKPPLDEAVNELHDTLKEKVVEKVRSELEDAAGEEAAKVLSPQNENESLIKSASASPVWQKRMAKLAPYLKGYAPSFNRRLLAGLVRVQAYGWNNLKTAGYTKDETLVLAYLVDRIRNKPSFAGERKVYSALAKANLESPCYSVLQELGRPLTAQERALVLEKTALLQKIDQNH